MKRCIVLVGLLLLAACGGTSPTGLTTSPPPPPPPPAAGLDPVVLFVNNRNQYGDGVPATMVWFAQSGLTRTTTLQPGERACVSFTSTGPTDSVRFVAFIGDTVAGPSAQTAMPARTFRFVGDTGVVNWFDPITGGSSAISSDSAVVKNYPHGLEFWTVTLEPWTPRATVDSTAPCVP